LEKFRWKLYKKPTIKFAGFYFHVSVLTSLYIIYILVLDLPKKSETINNTRKMKNKILAMEAAPAATPPNPRIAAIIATTRKITVQRSIVLFF